MLVDQQRSGANSPVIRATDEASNRPVLTSFIEPQDVQRLQSLMSRARARLPSLSKQLRTAQHPAAQRRQRPLRRGDRRARAANLPSHVPVDVGRLRWRRRLRSLSGQRLCTEPPVRESGQRALHRRDRPDRYGPTSDLAWELRGAITTSTANPTCTSRTCTARRGTGSRPRCRASIPSSAPWRRATRCSATRGSSSRRSADTRRAGSGRAIGLVVGRTVRRLRQRRRLGHLLALG